jgi:hypothetical protein
MAGNDGLRDGGAKLRPSVCQRLTLIVVANTPAHARTRQTLFRAVRPTGNVLPGYVPSFAMNRVMDEAG